MWAVSGVLARVLFNRSVDPALVVQVRLLVGGGLLFAWSALRRQARFPRAELPLLAAYAAGLVGVQLSYFKAIQHAGVAVAIFLQYTAPLLVTAWESIAERRVPSRAVLVAVALASCGSALLVLGGRDGLRLSTAGLAWGLAAAIAMAAETVLGSIAKRRGIASAPLLAYGLLLGSLALVPVRLPWEALAAVPAGDWPYYLYIAVFATAVPFLLYIDALDHLRGSVALVLAMLEPVLAGALAWAFLGEALAPAQVAGGALILAAVGLSGLRAT